MFSSVHIKRCSWTIRLFYKARAPVRLTQERPKCALHHGKMSTNKCRARYEITHEHVSNDLKMWIKRLHTEMHNIITIYIQYKSIYFKIITCIILGLVNSNVFACKTNSAFNDFVDSCVMASATARGRALCKTGELPLIAIYYYHGLFSVVYWF